jgi:cytochrome P450
MSPQPIDALPEFPFAETLRAWSGDLDGGVRALFAQTPKGLRRAGDRRVVAYANADLRALAAHPGIGNMPAEILTGKSLAAADREEAGGGQQMARLISNQVFTASGPLHAQSRQLLVRQLMPKSMPKFAPIATAAVAALVEEACDGEPIDFLHQFTERLTARFWAALLGMDAAEEARVVELVAAMSPMFYFIKEKEEVRAADYATREYLEIIMRAVERTLENGGSSLLSEMADDFDAIVEPGRPENLGVMLASNLIDGFHTAALASATAVLHLLRVPQDLARVRSDPTLMGAAFFEGVRLASPVIVTQRYAFETVEHEGVLIAAGTAIAMLWIAGNLDPDVFADPHTFSLARPQRGDVTFGGGGHICPGRHVARMLGEAVLAGVTASDVEIQLADPEVRWLPRSTMRQTGEMKVRIRRGT